MITDAKKYLSEDEYNDFKEIVKEAKNRYNDYILFFSENNGKGKSAALESYQRLFVRWIVLSARATQLEYNDYFETADKLLKGCIEQIDRIIDVITMETPPEQLYCSNDPSLYPCIKENHLYYISDLREVLEAHIEEFCTDFEKCPEELAEISRALEERLAKYPNQFVIVSTQTPYIKEIKKEFGKPIKYTNYGVMFEYKELQAEEQAPLKTIRSRKADDFFSEKPNKIKQVSTAQECLNASLLPSSSQIDLMYRLFKAGKDGIGELPDRIKKSTRGKKQLSIERKGKTRSIIQTGVNGVTEVQIENIELLETGKKGKARQLWNLFLSQVIEQALNNGELVKNQIIIKYDDVIEKKLYKNAKTASRGIERAFDVVSSIKVKGYITRKGKNSKREQVEAGVLFYHMKKTGKGSVIIYINENINWDFIVTAYFMIPNEYYALSGNAADLFYYIFYLARQRREEIMKNNGAFCISYRAIQNFLMLPDENTATKATTQIKSPIDEAIGNILDNVSPDVIELIPDNTEYIDITEYLDNRFLTVKLKGDSLKYYTDYFKGVNKTIAEKERRRQKT